MHAKGLFSNGKNSNSTADGQIVCFVKYRVFNIILSKKRLKSWTQDAATGANERMSSDKAAHIFKNVA
jgi:hypothetical protein